MGIGCSETHASRGSALKLAAACLALIGVCACTAEIDAAQVRVVNGLAYKLHDTEPFSGTIKGVRQYTGVCEREYENGRPHGKTVCLSEKGTKLVEQEWAQGRKNGIEKMWDPATGNLQVNASWKNGQLHGVFERYNPQVNRIIVRSEFNEGKREGRHQAWDVTGEHLLVDLKWANGNATGYRKVGQDEEHFVDGKLHGVRRTYLLKAGTPSVDAIHRAQNLAHALEGGVVFYGLYPDAPLAREERYESGVKVSESAPGSLERTSSVDASVPGCVDRWISAHRKEVGEESPIRSEQLDEWESWCKQGKQPG